jgi:biotin operon repressor
MTRIKYREAIGLEVKRGRPPAGPAPAKDQLVNLYVREGRSIRDIAAALGCSKDIVHKALKKYGIKVRKSAKRSRLIKLDQALLFGDIAEIGVDRTARKWSIPERTLKDYLARIRWKGHRK